MAAERGTMQSALGPLVADFERLTQTCRDLRAELEAEVAARRQVQREREQLLAEVARVRATAGRDEQTGAELQMLRAARGELERTVARHRDETETLAQRGAGLEADLEAARGELGVAEEERVCLEEQIRHLTRAVALLKAENRLLSREARPPGDGGAR